jgi:hypothetical protein
MTEVNEPQYDGPPRTWETTNTTPVSGSTVTVRAEYLDGGGVYLSAEHETGQPEHAWLSPQDWTSLQNWHYGCRNFERAVTPPRVCYPGTSVLLTWCNVDRIKVADEWWPRVGGPSEVTCPDCVLAEVAE